MSKKLIGIAGEARSGKDTVCEILIHHKVVKQRYAFADPLKDIINTLFGWGYVHAYGILKDQDVIVDRFMDVSSFFSKLEEYDFQQKFNVTNEEVLMLTLQELDISLDSTGFTIKPRTVYQNFGTDVGRDRIQSDIWMRLAPTENIVIPDVRFHNEASWIYDNGGVVIRVNRENHTKVANHKSESFVADLRVDYDILNNSTLHILEKTVLDIFQVDGGTNLKYPFECLGGCDTIKSKG